MLFYGADYGADRIGSDPRYPRIGAEQKVMIRG
jgi:hypothetical protein